MLVEKLSDGPLDIVGDVHGELDPLRRKGQMVVFDDGFHEALK